MRRITRCSGLGLLLLLWGLVLPFAGRQSFSAHMVVHMGVVAGVAPLLAVGLSGSALDITIRWRWLTPVLASIVELLAVWGRAEERRVGKACVRTSNSRWVPGP